MEQIKSTAVNILCALIIGYFVIISCGSAYFIGYLNPHGIGLNITGVDFNMLFQWFIKGVMSLYVLPIIIVLMVAFLYLRIRYIKAKFLQSISICMILFISIALMHITGTKKAESEVRAIDNYYKTGSIEKKRTDGLRYVYIEYGDADKPLKAEG